jgi:hypothetical protein
MPIDPTPAQQEASRRNGALSQGPKNTAQSSLNARLHGFTAALQPPEDPDACALYEQLLLDLAEEFLPCTRAEWLQLEQIVVLEMRRIRIQDTLTQVEDFSDDALKRLQLLSRYETDILNKLEKCHKKLRELQDGRGQRRGVALEAALVQRVRGRMEGQLRDRCQTLAERSLGRELADLAASPEEARDAAHAVLASGSFRNEPLSGSEPDVLAPIEVDEEHPSGLPGPPWNPWRDATPEELEAWNDRLIEREKQRLRHELQRLEAATEKPIEVEQMLKHRAD